MQNPLLKNRHSQNTYPSIPLLFLLFIGCSVMPACSSVPIDKAAAADPALPITPAYHSDTAPEDCRLCGDNSGTLLPVYSGQDNIGIISLNTFQLAPVSINQYDDNGNLVEMPSSGHSTHITNTGDNGFMLMISEDTDRGIAHGTLSFNQDEFLDMDNAASHLCSSCLSQAMESCSGTASTGICVIDFYTHKLRMLNQTTSGFQFDDYFVSCRARERQADENTLEMELLIFYCPKRYGN